MAVRQCFVSMLVFAATVPVFVTNAHSASAPPLQPNEQIVKTRDGCGFVVDHSKRGASYEMEAKSKLTWGGPCVAGLAMGEGWIAEGDSRYADIPPIRGWAWYGRIFGPIKSLNSSVFVWDGHSVSYTTLSTASPVWSKQHLESSRVSDGNNMVITSTRGCILESKRLPECKKENKFEVPGVTVFDLKAGKNTHYNCPDLRSARGCESLWAEHAGPVIARIKVFLAENEPKAEARKREIAPLIASWRPAPNAKQQDAARHAALRNAQLAEREQREAKQNAELEKTRRETERLQREIDAMRAENAAARKKAKEERARDRSEALNLLGDAAVAAAAGKNSRERKQLIADTLASGSGGDSPGTSGRPSGQGNDCHCIEIWADSAGERVMNVCDYPVAAPYCVVGYSCESGSVNANYIAPRGKRNYEDMSYDHYRVQNGTKSGGRLPWGYGAISRDKARQYKVLMTWQEVTQRGWVCSENRKPAELPPPSPTRNDIRVQ